MATDNEFFLETITSIINSGVADRYANEDLNSILTRVYSSATEVSRAFVSQALASSKSNADLALVERQREHVRVYTKNLLIFVLALYRKSLRR